MPSGKGTYGSKVGRPPKKKGKKGDALRNQMRILRDSKRGAAAGTDGVARNKRGEYYNS